MKMLNIQELEDGLSGLADPLWLASQSTIGSQGDVNNTPLLAACETTESPGWLPLPDSDMDSDMENGNIGSPSMSQYLIVDPMEYLNDPKQVMNLVDSSEKTVTNIEDDAFVNSTIAFSPASVLSYADCPDNTSVHSPAGSSTEYMDSPTVLSPASIIVESPLEGVDEISKFCEELDGIINDSSSGPPLPIEPEELKALLCSLSQEMSQPQPPVVYGDPLKDGSLSDCTVDPDVAQEQDSVYFQTPVEIQVDDIKPVVPQAHHKTPVAKSARMAVKRKAEDSDEDYVESRPKTKMTKQAQNREAAHRYRINKKAEAAKIEKELKKMTKIHADLLKQYNDHVNKRKICMDLIQAQESAGKVSVKWPAWWKK